MFMTLWKPAAAMTAGALAILWTAFAPSVVHAKPDLKAVFQAIDRNSDGAITADEFAQHPSNAAMQKLHAAHQNGMHAAMAAMHGGNAQGAHEKPSEETLRAHFAKIDVDSNGSVSFAEFQAFHDQMMAAHSAR